MAVFGLQLDDWRMIGDGWLFGCHHRIVWSKFQHSRLAVHKSDMIAVMMAEAGQQWSKEENLQQKTEAMHQTEGKAKGTIVEGRQQRGQNAKGKRWAKLGAQEGGGDLKE
jgi:hypothetical protein